MRKFNKDDESEIYVACNTIRACMTVSAAAEGIQNPSKGIGDITAKIAGGSIINDLVQRRDWENLFKNEEWLNILEGAQNLNFINGDRYKKYLITIAKFFPAETEGHIVVELL